VTPRSIQHVLRSLAETSPTLSDADLLRRFLANDDVAFGELVRRHGRLVWAVCRNLTRSDAEADDAFQATFLVLLKNAKKVRNAGKLSSWLHGVAYKVCAKSRQAAQRRNAREQTRAVREGLGSTVPDSAWDRALAAVHDEVAKLPDTLRVPFVLCCLEGVGVTEAAEQLGWKLGTLSGRLTRAKDAVLAKLEARGMTMGVVASVGLVTVPTAVAAKAGALAQVGYAIPGSILQLSQGVIGMSLKPVKLLAAAVILTCGLGLSVGTGWVTNAEAQSGTPGGVPVKPKVDAAAEVKRLQAELDRAKLDSEATAEELYYQDSTRLFAKPVQKDADIKTVKWEYDLVDILATFDKANFVSFLQEREAKGWEFLGSTTMGKSGGVFQWLFRRPVKVATATETVKAYELGEKSGYGYPVPEGLSGTSKVDDAKAIEAEIAKLQAKLTAIKDNKGKAGLPRQVMIIDNSGGLLDDASLIKLLAEIGEKKFGKGSIGVGETKGTLYVSGSKEVVEWASSVAQSLSGSPSGSWSRLGLPSGK